MACTCDGYERGDRAELDRLARLLCEANTIIDASGALPAVRGEELREWWAAHQRIDAERVEREAYARRLAQVRRDGVAKLTPEERAALGL